MLITRKVEPSVKPVSKPILPEKKNKLPLCSECHAREEKEIKGKNEPMQNFATSLMGATQYLVAWHFGTF